MRKNDLPTEEVEKLRRQLREIRQASLQATRQSDFRKVGELTAQAAALNKTIREWQGLITMELE